jgi:cyclopropane fatty-acyl-phospholipid synthase-like methyltransferase
MRLIASALKAFVINRRHQMRLAFERIIDRHYNIDTTTGAFMFAAEKCAFSDVTRNDPISYIALYHFISKRLLQPDDIFYDIGCGHGRVLCYVAQNRLRKCVGVEINHEFADRARRNAVTANGREVSIEIREGNAAEMNYSDGTIFFLFNPFGEETMKRFLHSVKVSLASNHRIVRFIYARPNHRCVLAETKWIKYLYTRKIVYPHITAEYWSSA